ncbi:MAG: hypothetical protein ACK56I_14260, partial [bacterium]
TPPARPSTSSRADSRLRCRIRNRTTMRPNRPRTAIPPSDVRSSAAVSSHGGPQPSAAPPGRIASRTARSNARPSAPAMPWASLTKAVTPATRTNAAARALNSVLARRRTRPTRAVISD